MESVADCPEFFPSGVVDYPVVHECVGFVCLPAPDAFFGYVIQLRGRIETLESENAALMESLEHEREWNKTHPVDVPCGVVKVEELVGDLQTLKSTHTDVVATLRAKVNELECVITKTLDDPRLKELDRKLTRLGRELKKTEGASRVIMELETENAFLHNEIDGMNALVKGFRSSEAEFKKMRSKVAETQRQLESESARFESALSTLQDENQQLSNALFVRAAENVYLSEAIKKAKPSGNGAVESG